MFESVGGRYTEESCRDKFRHQLKQLNSIVNRGRRQEMMERQNSKGREYRIL